MPTLSQATIWERTGQRFERKDFTWPNLVGQRVKLAFDCETTGLDIVGDDTPVGFGIVTEDRQVSEYFSWGHASGSYLDRDQCLQWARDNLLDGAKIVVGANLKFDFRMMRKIDVEFEGKCEHRDVQHEVALLDPVRQRKNLDLISQQFLGRGKIDPGPVPIHLQVSDVIYYYCVRDCELPLELDNLLYPRVIGQQLERVFKMEQQLTWAVINIEENALLADVEKLALWREKARARRISKMMELNALAGFSVHTSKRDDKLRLFKQLNLSPPKTPTGQPSFTMEWMEQFTEDKRISLLCDIVHLQSFEEKYLDKYWEALRDGKIYFSLHQLNSDEGGTISGRFSASAPSKDGSLPGINPQQVYKTKEQKKIAAIADMPIRELFIEEDGWDFFSADASQIEYRVFAHFVNDSEITKRYQEDPTVDFHQVIADMCEVDRDTVAKHANFAVLFGAGIDKFAWMVGKSREEAEALWNQYHKMFPGVRRLQRDTMDRATERGWVKTLLGRRRPLKDEEHKALSQICQGGAADLVKLTALELYEKSKLLGIRLRGIIHDEFIGGLRQGEGRAADLLEVLNHQRLPLRVPIPWSLKTGKNWKI